MSRWGMWLGLVLCCTAAGTQDVGAATLYAINTSHQVLTISTGAPSVPENTKPVTGLGAGETIVGCDVRPANGQLYVIAMNLANTGRLYTLNPATGVATFVAQLNVALTGGFFAMDFNPTVDRIRLISDFGQNLRVNPVDATVTVDTPTSNPPGGPTNGLAPHLFACAYTNNYAGASQTALYGIDTSTDELVVINNPNSGVVTSVGPLGVDVGGTSGFDIAPSGQNHAYAALPAGFPGARLFSIDLGTGHATDLGVIGSGDFLYGFAVAPDYPQTAVSRTQKINIAANGVGYQELSYVYSTGQQAISPYSASGGLVPYPLPLGEWTGVFHYDFGTASFTQAIYTGHDPL